MFAANDLAFANFKQCFTAINSASPEILASASETDYAVYVADCTETDEPMVGRGLLSQLLARPEVDISDTSLLLTGGVVSGRITSSLLSFIPGQAQETVEIRIRFVTIQKTSQIASLMSMFLYSSIQQILEESEVANICEGRWISELQEQGIWDQLLELKNSVLSEDDHPSHTTRRMISPKKAMSPFLSSPMAMTSPVLPASTAMTPVVSGAVENPQDSIRMVGRDKNPQNNSSLLSSSPTKHQTIIKSGRAQEIDTARLAQKIDKESSHECYNCRTLHASSWRKSLVEDESGVFNVMLCNPCGLWYVNKKVHRPRKYWGKIKDGRPIPPSKRGPRKKSEKNTLIRTKPKQQIQGMIDLTADFKQVPEESTPCSSHSSPMPTPMPTMVSTLPAHGLSRTHVHENLSDGHLKKRPFQALTQSLQQPPVFDNERSSMASRTASLPASGKGAKRPKNDDDSSCIDPALSSAATPVWTPRVTTTSRPVCSPALTPLMESTATMHSSPGNQGRSNEAAPSSPHRPNSSSSSGTPFLQPKALPPLPPITPQKLRLTPNKKDKTPDFLVGLSPSRWLSAYLGSSRSPSQFSNHTSPADHNMSFFSESDLFTESPFKGLCNGNLRSEPFSHATVGSMPPPSADDDFNMNVLPSSPSIFRMYKDNNDLFSSGSQSTDATSPINKLQRIARNSPDANKSLEESEEIGSATNTPSKA